LAAQHAEAVLESLHPLELNALIARMRPRPPAVAAPTKTPAIWRLGRTDWAKELFIRANCDSCHQEMTFTGPADTMPAAKFWHCGHGEAPPAAILVQYIAQKSGPTEFAQADRDRRETDELERKRKQQNSFIQV
jgi:hypothetical protein